MSDTSKDERLFNVDRATATGITRIASLVSVDEARALLVKARRAKAPGVCTRMHLSTRAVTPPAVLRDYGPWFTHGRRYNNRWNALPGKPGKLSKAQRAAIMAEAETCDE